MKVVENTDKIIYSSKQPSNDNSDRDIRLQALNDLKKEVIDCEERKKPGV